jgi:hypothetical protein
METGFFAKKDIRVFLSIVVFVLGILAALYFLDMRFQFIDNFSQKLYNIVVG